MERHPLLRVQRQRRISTIIRQILIGVTVLIVCHIQGRIRGHRIVRVNISLFLRNLVRVH